MNNSSQLNNERPLVTFSLFAFNQEQYIREAIEGAFSQTYEPLEIILSDDRSSDRTFEIMQEMAEAYQGPHRVIARQSSENRGLLNHILDVAHESHGEYIVVAAGDDISLPERTSIVIPYFKDREVLALSSDEVVIDEKGKVRNWDEARFAQRDIWHKSDNSWLHGATAVYRTNFLKMIPSSSNKINFEDTVFSTLIRAAGGESLRLKHSLIKYRHHSNNLSVRRIDRTNIKVMEENFINRWKSYLKVEVFCNQVINENSLFFYNDKNHLVRNQKIEYYSLISNWQSLTLYSKLKLFIIAIRLGHIKVILPRVFGKKIFFLLKRIRLQAHK